MKIIGITGSSGSGKSSVCKIIKKIRRAEIIDADEIAKELQDNKATYYEKIVETFGKDILLDNGYINRKKLANIIFSNLVEKEKLDKLTFKYVVEEIKNRIELLKKQDSNYIVVDAPTLIEAGMLDMFDIIIVVKSKENNKIDRICKRDGITIKEAQKRLASQKSDEFYEAYANFVISNDDEDIENKAKEILESIERENN